ncbi:MAG: hypothetical protein ACI9UR_002849, partial [Bacteroidia bacterium]
MLVNRNIINLYGQKLFELAQLTTPFRTYN